MNMIVNDSLGLVAIIPTCNCYNDLVKAVHYLNIQVKFLNELIMVDQISEDILRFLVKEIINDYLNINFKGCFQRIKEGFK